MSPGEGIESDLLKARIVELEGELQRRRRLDEAEDSRFRQLVDSAPVMVWMSGSDAMCNYFNRAWLQYRGRRLEDEIGNGWTQGIYQEDREHCLENYFRSFAARRPFRMQYRLQNAAGDFRWIEDAGLPFYEDSQFCGFMGVAADIHDRKCGVFTPDEDAVRIVFALTERERQVLVLIAGGKSTKETAATLGISYKTADSHRSRILEKLGVHETASMVRYAIRAGLVLP
jgi:PAS domain S-box-containing protein